jgi:hypothetical protein
MKMAMKISSENVAKNRQYNENNQQQPMKIINEMA